MTHIDCIPTPPDMFLLRPSPTLRILTSITRQLWKFQKSCDAKAYASSSAPTNEDGMFERLNWDQLKQGDMLVENLKRREETANVEKLLKLWKEKQIHMQHPVTTVPTDAHINLEEELVREALRLPNETHNAAVECGDTPKVIRTIGEPLSIQKPKDIQELCEPRGYLRKTNLGELVGTRAYILQGYLAELEQALINYTMDVLRDDGFQFISVPDFLYSHVIESCGFPLKSERNMVYEIDTEEGETPIYLSGTSEMAIAGYLSNRTLPASQLPLKLAALSRCFRAETSHVEEERGIYRVHNFSKVEMFAVTGNEDGNESEDLHNYFCQIQEKLFRGLGLHFRVMEMSPNELGSPAYRKCDIEAWMPGRKQFGEISSCSNCTDYQSRRLNIRYKNEATDSPKFVHTINGTACAIPRMLIAVIESHQDANGNVTLPDVLQKYMNAKWDTSTQKSRNATFMKNRKLQEKVVLHYDSWRE